MAAQFKSLFLLWMVFPTLISPGLALPTYDNTQGRALLRLDDRLVLPRSTTVGIDVEKKQQQPARLSRRTNGGEEEEALRRQQEEIAKQAEDAQMRRQWAAEKLQALYKVNQHYQELTSKPPSDELPRQPIEQESPPPGEAQWYQHLDPQRRAELDQHLKGLEEKRDEFFRKGERPRQEPHSSAEQGRVPQQGAAQPQEENWWQRQEPRLRQAQKQKEFIERMKEPQPEGRIRPHNDPETDTQTRRFDTCLTALKREGHELTWEEIGICANYASDPELKLNWIFSERAKLNEGRPPQNKETQGEDQNWSIATQAGQLARGAGDSVEQAIKQAVPAFLGSVGHVLSVGSGHPMKAAKLAMPVNPIPGVVVP
ncbi:MAG: hypothetical protein M1816_004662 [Peltula sp. TS41687]|nr:MAG: hypothetical protein M1816_004662 [Peltula sp. TS41687]